MKPFVRMAVFPTTKKYSTRVIFPPKVVRSSIIPSTSSFDSGARSAAPRSSSNRIVRETLAYIYAPIKTEIAADMVSEADETDYIEAEAVEVSDDNPPAEDAAPQPNKFMSVAQDDVPPNVDPETGEITG